MFHCFKGKVHIDNDFTLIQIVGQFSLSRPINIKVQFIVSMHLILILVLFNRILAQIFASKEVSINFWWWAKHCGLPTFFNAFSDLIYSNAKHTRVTKLEEWQNNTVKLSQHFHILIAHYLAVSRVALAFSFSLTGLETKFLSSAFSSLILSLEVTYFASILNYSRSIWDATPIASRLGLDSFGGKSRLLEGAPLSS